MKLNLTYSELSDLYQVSLPEETEVISSVAYDTRKIIDGNHTLFFCLKGSFRDGHDFIEQAYALGVRTFVVSRKPTIDLEATSYIEVDDVLNALQKLAQYHRKKFSYPVVAITGSTGKTTVKEWLAHLLHGRYNVVRSPKSYNSQLGVALSLLEMSDSNEIAIIEAGISQPGEMERLEQMIDPDLGIFTNIGSAHSENFESREQHLQEKLKLFSRTEKVIAHESIGLSDNNVITVHNDSYNDLYGDEFKTIASRQNIALAIEAAIQLKIDKGEILRQLGSLQPIALRQEIFEGPFNSMIINDTYNLDIDAFRSSLEYQLAVAGKRDRIVILNSGARNEAIEQLLEEYQPLTIHYVDSDDNAIEEIQNSVVLIKGSRAASMEKHARKYQLKKHSTFVEINLNAIRHNIELLRENLSDSTKVLAMVKASSYGSGGERMAKFLERIGVHYLGVAYADEGVELREAGIQVPIMVMNAERSGFIDCINNDLEPAIYSVVQLEEFIKECIYQGRSNYPIHIKLETGMNRLGFVEEELNELLQILQSQPEVKVMSVYSHLATSDDPASDFVRYQAEQFEYLSRKIMDRLPYEVDRHLLNSEGCINFPTHQFDMVRIGIGMYGYSANENILQRMEPAINWYSSVSQVKAVKKRDTIGYGRAGVAEKDMKIAIIPIGYADGFRRSLSNGKGGVYIQGKYCPIIGNVCMDMTMVDITDLEVSENDRVEIIGVNQPLSDLANNLQTIPYEVLTGISKRVHRIYLED